MESPWENIIRLFLGILFAMTTFFTLSEASHKLGKGGAFLNGIIIRGFVYHAQLALLFSHALLRTMVFPFQITGGMKFYLKGTG